MPQGEQLREWDGSVCSRGGSGKTSSLLKGGGGRPLLPCNSDRMREDGLTVQQERVGLDILNNFLSHRAVMHWHRLAQGGGKVTIPGGGPECGTEGHS